MILVEKTIRRFIKLFEAILAISMYIYFIILTAETLIKTYIIFIPLNLYPLILSVYYYTMLIKKSPGSLIDYSGLEVKGICDKCNRLMSNRTFHCDSCNKCYYKRDHHCPWIGKCIAEGNYKEFYFFVGFLTLFLTLRMLKCNGFDEISFFNNYLFVVFVFFFVWINFLLCIDRTSIEYHKNKGENKFFKYKSPWKRIEWSTFKDRIIKNLLDGHFKNIYYVMLPFLYQKAKIVNNGDN